MTSHAETAQAFLQAAQEARRMLDDEYRRPNPDNRKVADLHERVRFGLAAGKLEAQLAAAEAIERAAARIIAAGRSTVITPSALRA